MSISAVQGSDEWYAARLGKVTSSRIADMMARTKTGWGASRANYMAELVAERLTGNRTETYESPAMRRGKEMEADAAAAYAFLKDADLSPIGFVDHPMISWAGASPDRLVGKRGLLEIKVPNTATHLDTLLGAAIDGTYLKQMQWQMACTGRDWCDWVSFDPRLPARMQLFVQRVKRDDDVIATIEGCAVVFLGELAAKVEKLEKLYDERSAAA